MKSFFNKKLVRIGLILALSLLLGVLRNTLLPHGISFSDSDESLESDVSLSIEVELETAYQLYQQGIQFIDARSYEKYQESHIPGAMNIPAVLSFQEKMKITSDMSKEKKYVIYCNDTECPLSHELFEFMQVAGFSNLHIMYEGFDGWDSAGYNVKNS